MKHPDILAKMTLEEKVSLCSGKDYWHTADVPSAGVPSIMLTDGPHGIRKRRRPHAHGIRRSSAAWVRRSAKSA